jgi:hypothetical protein
VNFRNKRIDYLPVLLNEKYVTIKERNCHKMTQMINNTKVMNRGKKEKAFELTGY